MMPSVAAQISAPSPAAGPRLSSIDAFRGLTLAAMMVVNNPGDGGHVFAALRHAPWNGWTPTDLIFPFFLFLVGMSIPWSLKKYLESPEPSRALWLRIVRRVALLFLLGLILNGFPFKWEHLRVLGVLQRIALGYGVTAVLYGWLARRLGSGSRALGLTLAGIFTGLLVFYFVCMKYIPVPGYGAGHLELPEGNLAAYLDRLLLGGHLWSYAHYRWDPEGLFSTLPAIATTISGVLGSWWLQKTSKASRPLGKPVLTGISLVVLAYVLAPLFPINKSLWSSSYVLLTTGLAWLLYAVLYYLIEVKSLRWGFKPFLILGSNTIAVYFFSTWVAIRLIKAKTTGGISLQNWIYHQYFLPLSGNETLTSLLYALAYALLWLVVAKILQWRKIFIRV